MNIIHNELPAEKNYSHVVLDIEMFNQQDGKLHRPTGKFACLSLKFNGDDNVYQINSAGYIQKVMDFIRDIPIWILQKATYDLRHLRRWAAIPRHFVWDTLLVEKVMWGGYYVSFSLKDMARRYLGIQMDKSARDAFSSENIMSEDMKHYAAYDAVITEEVYFRQRDNISNPLRAVYTQVDEPMIWAVLDFQPVHIDVAGWEKLADEGEQRGKAIEAEIGVNVYSPKQVLSFVNSRLPKKLQITSTGEEVLSSLPPDPMIDKILEARMWRKASSTYGHKWLASNVEEDGNVYADWNITGAETGRMSCSSPNLQQIPSRKIHEYRDLFTAPKGMNMIIADVAQQEPRITAYLSHDKNLRKVFQEGRDIHLEVTRAVFHDDTIEKSDPRRSSHGKPINLGITYGMSARGLAGRIGVTEEEAQKFIDSYFQRFPGVQRYIITQRQLASKYGWVSTPYGRKIWLNPYDQSFENNAINAPIQGGASDMTKVWVTKLWQMCHDDGMTFPVGMVIHDELVLYVWQEDTHTYLNLLKRAFDEAVQQVFPGDVPFAYDVSVGSKWSDKK